MIRYFKKYRGFIRCAVSAKLNYRSRLITTVIISAMEMIASIFLWNALFKEQTVINGYAWNDTIIYYMVAFVMNATLAYNTESNISSSVLDGSIAMDLIKPISYQSRCFFQTIGSSIVEGSVALVFAAIAMLLLCDVGGVVTFSRLMLLLISGILAFVVKFCISYIAGLCCFFTSNGVGIIYMRQVVTDIFSGALLPLSFYPMWFQKVAAVLPFQAVVYTPAQIFLGRMQEREIVHVLLLQVFWIVVLWAFGHFFFRLSVQKITIQGG